MFFGSGGRDEDFLWTLGTKVSSASKMYREMIEFTPSTVAAIGIFDRGVNEDLIFSKLAFRKHRRVGLAGFVFAQ